MKEKVATLDQDLTTKQEEAKTLGSNYENLENRQIVLWNHIMGQDKKLAKIGIITNSKIEIGNK